MSTEALILILFLLLTIIFLSSKCIQLKLKIKHLKENLEIYNEQRIIDEETINALKLFEYDYLDIKRTFSMV